MKQNSLKRRFLSLPFRSGEVLLREEDSRGQGRIDPIETFSHGQLVKRSIDSKGSGQLDALYLFKDGRLIRDERQYKVRCLPLRFVKIGFTFVA